MSESSNFQDRMIKMLDDTEDRDIRKIENAQLIRDLIDVGTGKIQHLYRGYCPDTVDGHECRDKQCSACLIIIRATPKNKKQP